jgi:hypothetical protein
MAAHVGQVVLRSEMWLEQNSILPAYHRKLASVGGTAQQELLIPSRTPVSPALGALTVAKMACPVYTQGGKIGPKA